MASLVSRIAGYRENERGHFRQVEAASRPPAPGNHPAPKKLPFSPGMMPAVA